jgi:hypothetical protein
MIRKSFRLPLTILGATALLALGSSAYAAGDSMKEAMTAATHAGFAAKSANIKQVHMHLHHAINCLEGPNGEDFDKTNANPCAAIGNGAIADSSDSAMKEKWMKAVSTAKMGLATDDLAKAQKDATDVEMALKPAE